MIVKNYIKVCFPISNISLQYRLGKGVEFYLDDISDGLVLFLLEQFEKNPDSLTGDIRSLYEKKRAIEIGHLTYREYLEAKMSKGFGSQ